MNRDPLAALADYLDPSEPGSRACVIEVGCDDAVAIVAEVQAARELRQAAAGVAVWLRGMGHRPDDFALPGEAPGHYAVPCPGCRLIAAVDRARDLDAPRLGPDLAALRDGEAAGSGEAGGAS